jgi:hypothetical protein
MKVGSGKMNNRNSKYRRAAQDITAFRKSKQLQPIKAPSSKYNY